MYLKLIFITSVFQATSPACTELEVTTTDWLGKMIGLPDEFLHCTEGPGGGVIQVYIIFRLHVIGKVYVMYLRMSFICVRIVVFSTLSVHGRTTDILVVIIGLATILADFPVKTLDCIWRFYEIMFCPILNKRQRIEKSQSKMDNLEKLATQGSQDEHKHDTICIGHHYLQTNTNNVNKT